MQCNINGKDRLRREMKSKRRSLSPAEVEKLSREACDLLFETEFFSKSEVVCVYMSAFNEVDTKYITEKCLKLQKTVIVPVVDGDDIYPAVYDENTKKGAFGISEPVNKTQHSKYDIDLFIIPGLAFGRCGERVGFGKGYYDKLLKNTDGIKTGFLYDFQLTDEIETEKHDIYMDYLITESKVIDCALQRYESSMETITD